MPATPARNRTAATPEEPASIHVNAVFPLYGKKAMAALQRLRAATADVRPNPRGGAIAAVRRLRDGR
ncbi:hypothetical protein [Ramlibacter sp.]|uniref:hypothetical protein n=1 Tax=Ramlibacter sp. TaxID=1917967 RepID=UPI003D11EA84